MDALDAGRGVPGYLPEVTPVEVHGRLLLRIDRMPTDAPLRIGLRDFPPLAPAAAGVNALPLGIDNVLM